MVARTILAIVRVVRACGPLYAGILVEFHQIRPRRNRQVSEVKVSCVRACAYACACACACVSANSIRFNSESSLSTKGIFDRVILSVSLTRDPCFIRMVK